MFPALEIRAFRSPESAPAVIQTSLLKQPGDGVYRRDVCNSSAALAVHAKALTRRPKLLPCLLRTLEISNQATHRNAHSQVNGGDDKIDRQAKQSLSDELAG